MENGKGNVGRGYTIGIVLFLTLFHKRPMAGCDVYGIGVAEFMEFVRGGTGARSVITVNENTGGLVGKKLGHFLGEVGARQVERARVVAEGLAFQGRTDIQDNVKLFFTQEFFGCGCGNPVL